MISTNSRVAMTAVVLAGLIFCTLNGAIPSSAAALSGAQDSSDKVTRITPEEVRELLKEDKAVLVDVRGSAAYKAGHIKGALNIAYSDIADRAGELPRDKIIATYCSCPNEHTSAGAVINLKTKGITNAAAVLGGYDGLVKAGLPTETSN
jgi:rhodanese-related sulfurtransferase